MDEKGRILFFILFHYSYYYIKLYTVQSLSFPIYIYLSIYIYIQALDSIRREADRLWTVHGVPPDAHVSVLPEASGRGDDNQAQASGGDPPHPHRAHRVLEEGPQGSRMHLLFIRYHHLLDIIY